MHKLSISLIWPGCAMGRYILKAKGCLLAILRWGNADGSLPDWSPIAYVPIDPAGNGEFFFPGRRAIPREATHVWAHFVSYDFSAFEDVGTEIPERFRPTNEESAQAQRFSVLCDLHLATRPWVVKRALLAAESDVILLAGDSVNDGTPVQFEGFEACIEEAAPEKTLLPVPGNHDVTLPKCLPQGADGLDAYAAFQSKLLDRATGKGYHISFDPDSLGWAARLGGLDVIGMQCVVGGRSFRFPDGAQLDWLDAHLRQSADAARHVILCHAPLLRHNPNRNVGNPYLDKDRCLQELLDRHGSILFLSGHTHVSPNCIRGNGEIDGKTGNIYLDCGSVVPTDTGGEVGLLSPDWKDGCITELSVSEKELEIRMKSIETGKVFTRGYYRFSI